MLYTLYSSLASLAFTSFFFHSLQPDSLSPGCQLDLGFLLLSISLSSSLPLHLLSPNLIRSMFPSLSSSVPYCVSQLERKACNSIHSSSSLPSFRLPGPMLQPVVKFGRSVWLAFEVRGHVFEQFMYPKSIFVYLCSHSMWLVNSSNQNVFLWPHLLWHVEGFSTSESVFSSKGSCDTMISLSSSVVL